MSSTYFANVHWGGTIVRNQFGYDYEGGQSAMFEFGNISTYDELRATVERELNITGNQCIQSLMFRQPIFANSCIMYNIVEVHNNAAVTMIQQFVRQFGFTGFIQFYATIYEQQLVNDSVGEDFNVGEDDVGGDDDDDDDSSDEEDDFWPSSDEVMTKMMGVTIWMITTISIAIIQVYHWYIHHLIQRLTLICCKWIQEASPATCFLIRQKNFKLGCYFSHGMRCSWLQKSILSGKIINFAVKSQRRENI